MATKVTKLVPHAGELALIIDKATLKKLKIDESTELEIIIQAGNFVVRPKTSRARTRQIANQLMDKYAPVFEKLAKT
ncbi:MAG TPA: hypothetical protein VJJ83_04810 [Candidatus Babeliales bacterium]|nr:hypothetical protein [Candidatus Babeliales bacterium]